MSTRRDEIVADARSADPPSRFFDELRTVREHNISPRVVLVFNHGLGVKEYGFTASGIDRGTHLGDCFVTIDQDDAVVTDSRTRLYACSVWGDRSAPPAPRPEARKGSRVSWGQLQSGTDRVLG